MKRLLLAMAITTLFVSHMGARPLLLLIPQLGRLCPYIVETSATIDIFSQSSIDELIANAQNEGHPFIYLAIVIKSKQQKSPKILTSKTVAYSVKEISVYEAIGLATHFNTQMESARNHECDSRIGFNDPTTRQAIKSVYYFEIDTTAVDKVDPNTSSPLLSPMSDEALHLHGFKTTTELVKCFEDANEERIFSPAGIPDLYSGVVEGADGAEAATRVVQAFEEVVPSWYVSRLLSRSRVPAYGHTEAAAYAGPAGDDSAGPAEAAPFGRSIPEAHAAMSSPGRGDHEQRERINNSFGALRSGTLNEGDQLWLLETIAQNPSLVEQRLDPMLTMILLQLFENLQIRIRRPDLIDNFLSMIIQLTIDVDCQEIARTLLE